jgi:rare lipoprotein A
MENIRPAIRSRMMRLAMSLIFGAMAFNPSLALAHNHHHSRATAVRHEQVNPRTYRNPRLSLMRPTGYLAHTQHGIASVYDTSFNRRRMADGARFSIWSDSAASRTLPLGTIALVTNTSNGRRISVCIRDRGPYVGHRLLDMSPATAHALGMGQPGLMHITIRPIRIPLTSNARFVSVDYRWH